MPGTFSGAGDTAVNKLQPPLFPCSDETHFLVDRAMFVTAIGSWMDLTTVVVMAGHQYLLFSPLSAYGRTVPACPTELMHGELTCSGHEWKYEWK